jgi:hypothetical protein
MEQPREGCVLKIDRQKTRVTRVARLEHGEERTGEGAEVVGVAVREEVEGSDGEDGDEDAHHGEGVEHCRRRAHGGDLFNNCNRRVAPRRCCVERERKSIRERERESDRERERERERGGGRNLVLGKREGNAGTDGRTDGGNDGWNDGRKDGKAERQKMCLG